MTTNAITRRGSMPVLPLLAMAGATVATACVAQEPWPNLNDAENHLRAALEALARAPDRFAGHKAEAMRLIQGALGEIEQAKRSFR